MSYHGYVYLPAESCSKSFIQFHWTLCPDAVGSTVSASERRRLRKRVTKEGKSQTNGLVAVLTRASFLYMPVLLLLLGSEQGLIFSPSALNLTLLHGLGCWNAQVLAIKIIGCTQHTHLAPATRKGGSNFNAIYLISGIRILLPFRNSELHFLGTDIGICQKREHSLNTRTRRRVYGSCRLHPAPKPVGFCNRGVDKSLHPDTIMTTYSSLSLLQGTKSSPRSWVNKPSKVCQPNSVWKGHGLSWGPSATLMETSRHRFTL